MKVNEIVTDASLQPVLQTTAETLAQCHRLLSLLDPTSSSSPPSQETLLGVSKQQKLLFALLARLRGLNRDAIIGVRATKQATAEARQEIDRLHLHLQNLYYEQRHLNGEIAACESYEYVFPPPNQNHKDHFALLSLQIDGYVNDLPVVVATNTFHSP